MTTITTRQGKQIEVISQRDLRSPLPRGAYVRAYCHIHGSDHQRSLSIQRASGWGHCFNSSCGATVLVPWLPSPRLPLALQPMLLHVTETPQPWQQNELRALSRLDVQMETALAHSQRALLYLTERGIPLSVALATGTGYLPPVMLPRFPEHHSVLQRWAARLVFPLTTPTDQGYIGRALWRWQPGMDENKHKAVLEHLGNDKGNSSVRRWIKTNPAGWFCAPFEQLARRLILVEGAFDRLTLLAAGFDEREVVALVGTALQVEWLPPQVHTVVLALDGDQGGRESSQRLTDHLTREGFAVETCLPPSDQWGKDWNERWRRIGQEGIRPLRTACSTLRTA